MQSPEEMGLTAASDSLSKNLDAPVNYLKVLMAGDGPANKSGDDEFIETDFSCQLVLNAKTGNLASCTLITYLQV